MMKYSIVAIGLLAASAPALSQDVYVPAHTTANGTFVQGHYQTAPNNTKTDNYSTRGNINPYTGKEGTVDPYAPPRQKKPKTNW